MSQGRRRKSVKGQFRRGVGERRGAQVDLGSTAGDCRLGDGP